MRFIYCLLSSLLLAWSFTWLFPWWISLLPPAIIAALLYHKAACVFLMSAVPTAILWTSLSGVAMTHGSDLAHRVATLFQLPATALLIIITVLLGSLLSGLTGLAVHSVLPLRQPDIEAE